MKFLIILTFLTMQVTSFGGLDSLFGVYASASTEGHHQHPAELNEHESESTEHGSAENFSHEHTHSHGPGEPEHSHSHQHSFPNAQQSFCTFRDSILLEMAISTSLSLSSAEDLEHPSPYLGSLFRPPIV